MKKDPSRKLASLFYLMLITPLRNYKKKIIIFVFLCVRWDHENTMIWCIVYHHHLISNKPWHFFHSCFFSFLCSRKVSRATHFSPEHSMVNNLRGAKGQWKWPSILDTPSSSKSLWLYDDDDEQKKLKKENRRPPKKEERAKLKRACQAFLFFSFPWA